MALFTLEVYLPATSWDGREVLLIDSFSTKRPGEERDAYKRVQAFVRTLLTERPQLEGRLRVREFNERFDEELCPRTLRSLAEIAEEERERALAAAPAAPGFFAQWEEYTQLLEQVARHADFLSDPEAAVSPDIRAQVETSLRETIALVQAHELWPESEGSVAENAAEKTVESTVGSTVASDVSGVSA